MCFDERKTESRGRGEALRAIRPRTRERRRSKRDFTCVVIALEPLLLLAFLAANGLGVVLDALALIGFRLAIAANDGRDLSDALAIGAGNADRGRLLAGDLDVVGDREVDLMTVAELQIEALALHRRAVADAVDLEIDREPLRDAGDHIVDQRPRRAPQGARTLGVALWLHPELAVL